jgi:hypothetical protein
VKETPERRARHNEGALYVAPELRHELKHGNLPANWARAIVAGVLWLFALLALFFAVAMIFILILMVSAKAQEQYPNCRGFIQQACCCTNNCCFEIKASDVTPIDDGGKEWIVRETGERVTRTQWSEDGKFYRCACELRDGKYVIDRKDRTRCIIPAKAIAGS